MSIRTHGESQLLFPLLMAAGLLGAAFGARAAEIAGPATMFARNCSGCHSYGRGVKVGPDLKGVTARRTRSWLHRFIRSSRSVIRANDAVAVDLFRRFKQQQMPDWNLSDTQIDALLDYFASGGPDRKPVDQRHGATASSAEIARGRRLFTGQQPLRHVGFACNSCHTVAGDAALAGGSLGPDLSASYARYQDQALTSRLKQPCPPVAASVAAGTYLTPDESFALKAYLRRAAAVAVPAFARK